MKKLSLLMALAMLITIGGRCVKDLVDKDVEIHILNHPRDLPDQTEQRQRAPEFWR